MSKPLLCLTLALLLAACSVGPKYLRPTAEAPAAFKELQGWKTAQPRDTEARGKWWEGFGDSVLNTLEEQVSVSNQSLVQAEAQYRQAVALAQASRAGLYPTLGTNASVTRSWSPSGSNSTRSLGVGAGQSTAYSLSLQATWELDLWGRLRRQAEIGTANAQASAADLEATRLSLQAQLAQNYFQMRALEMQKRILDDTVVAFEKSLQLTKNRYASGVVARADIVQADTLLKTTQAQRLDLGVQHAQLEHAIALLIGKPAPSFSVPPAPLSAVPKVVPTGIPSDLLERRPDVAAAERRVAAANAQIGVAQAAFFPTLSLTGSAGFESTSLSNWISAPSRFWSLGPALALPLFDAGLRRAQTNQAVAAYDAEVAAYRQTVLISFGDVEDNLAALRVLEQEASVQDDAVKSARLSVDLTLNQYKAGIVSYLNVITVQTTLLGDERAAADILSRRLVASVLLIKALGGGWSTSELPAADTVASFRLDRNLRGSHQ
jgi:NodT family efflux transporter outer membrane factor (OMF) lipoprotein